MRVLHHRHIVRLETQTHTEKVSAEDAVAPSVQQVSAFQPLSGYCRKWTTSRSGVNTVKGISLSTLSLYTVVAWDQVQLLHFLAVYMF